MTRRLSKLVVFLLLGAIVNVAVAWYFAKLSPGSATVVVTPVSAIEKDWLRPSQWDWEKYPLECRIATWRCLRVNQLVEKGIRGPSAGVAAEMRAGFPTLSLVGRFTPNCSGPREWDPYNLPWDSEGFWAYDHQFPHTSLGKVLPLIPIWPGFAINTIFYAAVLGLLLAAPFKVRRWRRTRRGLCPVCAYPVGTSPTCTECGRPVRPSSVETVA